VTPEDIETRFAYHAPATDDKRRQHAIVRERCQRLAEGFNAMLPEGREKSTAITKLEEVMFWANAALARNA